jgi:hypothetical protein
MKKIYLLFISFLALNTFGQTHNGNGKNGFGGALGQGSLTIEFRNDSAHFTFTKGPGALNDAVVIYIMGDVKDPNHDGFSSTANFTDQSDGLRKAISGFQGADRSVLTFANGFTPNQAIAFNKDFAGMYWLKENSAHEFWIDCHLQPTGDANASVYKFSLEIGNNSPVPTEFRFLVTYISETGYRSNEFIGDVGPANNPGYTPYVSTSYLSGFTPATSTFYGNGKNGFGGAIGESKLKIETLGDSTFFILTKGSGDFNDIVVIYAQGNVPGHPTGISSTANFIDHADRFRSALSGFNGTDRSILTFANKFHPDAAFVFDKNSGSFFELTENGSHTLGGSLSIQPSGTSGALVYRIGFETPGNGSEEDGGIGNGFGFLLTYFSETLGRSNEFVGDPGPNANPGWGPFVTTTFGGDPGDPVPVTLMSFGANYINNKVNLQWTTSQESNIEKYEVLRSSDGNNFSKIGAVNATNSLLQQIYTYVDLSPLNGNNLYKLGIVSKDGQVEFSKIVSVKSLANNSFKAYTTSSNRVLKIELSSVGTENLVVEMTNSIGQKVFQSQVKPNGSNIYTIDLNKKLPIGIYSVIVSIGGEKNSKMILIK